MSFAFGSVRIFGPESLLRSAAEREIDLRIERRVSANVSQIQQKARQDAEDQAKLKVAEKDQVIQSM